MKKEKKKGIEFSVEWFAFQKFNSSRNFWKLSGNILYLFESFGWMYGKRPLSTDHVCLYSCHKPPTRKLFQGAFNNLVPRGGDERLTQISAERKCADKSLISFLILFYFSQRYGSFKNSSVRLLHPQCFPGSNPFFSSFFDCEIFKSIFFLFLPLSP